MTTKNSQFSEFHEMFSKKQKSMIFEPQRLLSSRKAQTDLSVSTLIEMIMLVLVIGLMLAMAYKETTSTKYDKFFLSKDTAMFIDALHASPNTIIVKYPQKTKDYSFKIEDSKVKSYANSEFLVLGESFPYTSEKGIEIEQSEDQENDTTIIFTKTKTKITKI